MKKNKAEWADTKWVLETSLLRVLGNTSLRDGLSRILCKVNLYIPDHSP